MSPHKTNPYLSENAHPETRGWGILPQSVAGASRPDLKTQGTARRSEDSQKIETMNHTTTLYRPVGPEELELIRQADWKAFPPRLPEQPIFYPVTNEEYAIQIARDWNVRDSGSGHVTRFEVDRDFLSRYEVQQVGGQVHRELWIPAEELEEFNRHIIGTIEVIRTFGKE